MILHVYAFLFIRLLTFSALPANEEHIAQPSRLDADVSSNFIAGAIVQSPARFRENGWWQRLWELIENEINTR